MAELPAGSEGPQPMRRVRASWKLSLTYTYDDFIAYFNIVQLIFQLLCMILLSRQLLGWYVISIEYIVVVIGESSKKRVKEDE